MRQRPRDAHALAWLAQMYGAPLGVAARVLDTTERATREVLRRWRAAGWADSARIDDGPPWVWPSTSTAAHMLGWAPGPWRPAPTTAAHIRAAAEVRLALAGVDLAAWIPGRELAHQAPEGRHVPAGVWLRGGADESDNVVIDVAPAAAHPARTRAVLQAALWSAAEHGAREVWYLAGSVPVRSVAERAAADIRRAEGRRTPELQIRDLSDIIH